MKKKKKKTDEELFQIFFDGNDFCAQTEMGLWHVAVHESNGEIRVKEHDKKPDRFVNYQLLTFKQIRQRQLYMICVDLYCSHEFLEGAKSMSELADRLKAEVQYVKSLERSGWEFVEPIKDGHAKYYVPLKPF